MWRSRDLNQLVSGVKTGKKWCQEKNADKMLPVSDVIYRAGGPCNKVVVTLCLQLFGQHDDNW